jgi:V/A-type H+-transporting ATPase subunit D
MQRLPATRTALLGSKDRRKLARRGADLLRSKRQALAAELFAVVRRVAAERARLEACLREAVRALAVARALEGEEVLASLALAGAREVPVDIVMRKVWGIPIPQLTAPRLRRDHDARGASPLDAGFGAAEAARRHEEALEIILGVCSEEIRLKRVGEEIRATSRRINALEEIVIPGLSHEIGRIALVLEERAREDIARLKRFKARRTKRAR